jgi:hypothetical protein
VFRPAFIAFDCLFGSQFFYLAESDFGAGFFGTSLNGRAISNVVPVAL